MDRFIAKFQSHEEAELADREYYLRLSPAERIHILLELIERHHEGDEEASGGFARVFRITNLNKRFARRRGTSPRFVLGFRCRIEWQIDVLQGLLVQDKADLDSLGEP